MGALLWELFFYLQDSLRDAQAGSAQHWVTHWEDRGNAAADALTQLKERLEKEDEARFAALQGPGVKWGTPQLDTAQNSTSRWRHEGGDWGGRGELSDLNSAELWDEDEVRKARKWEEAAVQEELHCVEGHQLRDAQDPTPNPNHFQ